MFHTFSDWVEEFSLTPCFSGVFGGSDDPNRFNGFLHTVETVETVPTVARSFITPLKHGVNEKAVKKARRTESSGSGDA